MKTNQGYYILGCGIIFLVFHSMLFAYDWPVGEYAGTEHGVSSTFMEYRDDPNLHFHNGIDVFPLDGHQTVYAVANGTVSKGGSGYLEWIRVGNYAYVHVSVNSTIQNGDNVVTYESLGIIYQNTGEPHVHFKDGPVSNLVNPLTAGHLEPYNDNSFPTINSISLRRDQNPNTIIETNNVNGNVDIIVNCYDDTDNYSPPTINKQPGIYRIDYWIEDEYNFECDIFGQEEFISNFYEFVLETNTSNPGFSMIWNSDNNLFATNKLNASTGTPSNGYFQSDLFRNGNYHLLVQAYDIAGTYQNFTEQNYDITINNPAQVKTSNIQNISQSWYGENLVTGHYETAYNRNVLRVTNSALYFEDCSRVTIASDVWLIIESGSTLNIEGSAEVCLEPGAEIIGETNGTVSCNSNKLSFLGSGACFYAKGAFSFAENLTYNFDNGGLLIVDGGELTLGDNVILQFQNTADQFEIKPGSTLKMGQNARIDMYGKMLAQGTAANPITFTSAQTNPGPGDWRGINFYNSADDASIIEYVTMEYALTGLWLNSASPTIRHNTLRNGHLYNLRLDYSTALIEDNIIENSNLISGVYARYSDATFDNNTIRNHGKDGMYLYQSNPVMINNTVTNNTRYGIYCYGYSSPQLGTSTTQHGYNLISNNDEGIHAYNNSNPFLGISLGSKTIGGYNSIKSNSAWGVSATSNSNLQAEYNWWGHTPIVIGDVYTDGTSSIDYSPEMTSDPGAGASKMLTIGTPEFDGLETPGQNPKDGPPYAILLRFARQFRGEKQFPRAIGIYKRLMKEYANSAAAQWGVMELINTYREAGLDSVVVQLQSALENHPNSAVRRVAGDLLTGSYLRKGQTDAAIAQAQQNLGNYVDTESEKLALFDLFSISLQDRKDLSQAQAYLARLQAKYPGDELTLQAQLLFGGSATPAAPFTAPLGKNQLSVAAPAASVQAAVPTEYALSQNFPNPFNPSTTISIALPNDSPVTLELFDISGRKVRTLIQQNLSAGFHDFEWDGRNDAGQQVSSGMYIYRLTAGRFSQTRKMMLMR